MGILVSSGGQSLTLSELGMRFWLTAKGEKSLLSFSPPRQHVARKSERDLEILANADLLRCFKGWHAGDFQFVWGRERRTLADGRTLNHWRD